jgi:Rhs element Vgr protein
MVALTIAIKSEGTLMDSAYDLMSVDVVKELNRIPYAQIVLLDGSTAKKTFPISDQVFFEPGKLIEIEIIDGDVKSMVFKGLVVRHSVQATRYGSTLTIELKDEAVKLTQIPKSALFKDKTDTKVCGDLISIAGLKKGTISATKVTHKQLVQYHCTDWDFLLSRAESSGLLVSVDDGTVSLVEPQFRGDAKHTFEYGISEILDFEIEASAEHQYAAVESVGWDVKKQAATKPASAKNFTLTQSNLKADALAKKIGGEKYTQVHGVPLDANELQAWSDGAMIRSRMSMLRGRISVPGFGDIKPLDLMEVSGIGKRFNGKTIVTGIRHRVHLQGWRTDVQFGLSPQSFARKSNIIEPLAAGLLPGVTGLQVGIVDQFEADPDKELRVKVRLPALDGVTEAVWARLITPDAGKDRGFFFFPEPGDEVVVGFFNNDPRQAVILGSMFSSKNPLAKDLGDPTADNINKGIVTKSGTKLVFIDDKKAAVFIETPAGNTVLVDDDAQSILLKDQHGNSVLMNKDGIEIKSAKDLVIDASGNVDIKGSKVNIK